MYELHYKNSETKGYRIRRLRTLTLAISKAYQLQLTAYSILLNGSVVFQKEVKHVN